MLGPGNDEAAQTALAAWPNGLQVGGGIKDTNAKQWIDAGAERVGVRAVFWNDHMLIKRSRSSSHLSYSHLDLFLLKDYSPFLML